MALVVSRIHPPRQLTLASPVDAPASISISPSVLSPQYLFSFSPTRTSTAQAKLSAGNTGCKSSTSSGQPCFCRPSSASFSRCNGAGPSTRGMTGGSSRFSCCLACSSSRLQACRSGSRTRRPCRRTSSNRGPSGRLLFTLRACRRRCLSLSTT